MNTPEFAAAAGVPLWVMRGALNGTLPNPANAKKIADYVGCRVTDLWPVT